MGMVIFSNTALGSCTVRSWSSSGESQTQYCNAGEVAVSASSWRNSWGTFIGSEPAGSNGWTSRWEGGGTHRLFIKCCSRCASGYGNSCTSAPNICGQTSSGTIQCDGSCSATTPPNSSCPPPTASCSVSPNPMPYGGNPGITLNSTNGYYCHVYNDWSEVKSGYFTSGTYYPGAQTTLGTHTAQVYCYNVAWVGSGWSYCNYTVSLPLPTAAVSVSPNPVPYGGNPGFTLSSTNAYYCYVLMDGFWAWNASGYFTSGTYYPGALTSPGAHSAWAYCYNSEWAGSGWSITPFTVNPAPINGVCGPADNNFYPSSYSSPPADKLCEPDTGTASAISGDGSADNPWKWTCSGLNEGNPSPICSAEKCVQTGVSWGSCSASCGGGTEIGTYRDAECNIKSDKTRSCASRPCPPSYKEVAPW
ncbi:hypothetical protein KJ761_01520 [Patescibacteria group bacterium]|nr:hypothetical protein [Patescibacteria group bacterium]